ncbi:MAG: DUF1289 domain-containing protein [Lysobacteraceae bacterium]|nr:DUF1289 domain-containing protein [Xanthomonadaceae bacterium]
MKAILSPCIGVCALDASGHCTGCFRSTDEIANWRGYSDEQRLHLMDVVLPQREDAFAQHAGQLASNPVFGLETLG